MYKQTISGLQLWQFEKLTSQQGIKHFVSGRSGGVSEGVLGSLNLSFKVGDDFDNVIENRRRIGLAMGVSDQKLVFPVQTHSVNVRLVDHLTTAEALEDTDALVTNEKGICIAVMSADCVPVLLYDPVHKVVASAHAGWKGTVGQIAARTLKVMQDHFGSNPSEIVACIGPSICPEVYEVGPEVIEAVYVAFGKEKGLVHPAKEEGKGYLNLWQANKLQLLAAGVEEENIEVAGLCTWKNSEEFFSARKSMNQTGRFAAGIMIE